VDGCGARRTHRARRHDRHRHRRRHHRRWPPLHGASDCAGEIGHITIDVNGTALQVRQLRLPRSVRVGPAIARGAVEAIESGAPSRLADFAAATWRGHGADGYEAAADGDDLAREVVSDTAKYLGAGIANLVNVLNPEIVVVCGGVTLAGEWLFGPLRREVARRAFRPAVDACRIVPGALVGSAGVYGAACAFLQQRDA
jgi:glucokinase